MWNVKFSEMQGYAALPIYQPHRFVLEKKELQGTIMFQSKCSYEALNSQRCNGMFYFEDYPRWPGNIIFLGERCYNRILWNPFVPWREPTYEKGVDSPWHTSSFWRTVVCFLLLCNMHMSSVHGVLSWAESILYAGTMPASFQTFINERPVRCRLLCLSIVAVLAAVIGIIVCFDSSIPASVPGTGAPTMTPSLAPTFIADDIIVAVAGELSQFSDFADTSSPQFKAVSWMSTFDEVDIGQCWWFGDFKPHEQCILR